MTEEIEYEPEDDFEGKFDDKPEIIWLTLPGGEPAILATFLDVLGSPTKDEGEAVYVIGVDRFKRFHRLKIDNDTFTTPRLQ